MISNFCSQIFRFVFFFELKKTEILSVGYDVRFFPKINSTTAKTLQSLPVTISLIACFLAVVMQDLFNTKARRAKNSFSVKI